MPNWSGSVTGPIPATGHPREKLPLKDTFLEQLQTIFFGIFTLFELPSLKQSLWLSRLKSHTVTASTYFTYLLLLSNLSLFYFIFMEMVKIEKNASVKMRRNKS